MSARRIHTVVAALLLLAAAAGPARAGVTARLSRGTIEVGDATTLLVTVSDVSGGISEPRVSLQDGLELLGTSRSTNFAWVNGRTSNSTVFRLEIGASTAGHYTLGPILVNVGSQTFRVPPVALTVNAASNRMPGTMPRGRAGRSDAATLTLDVTPRHPYVGQPVMMTLRLIQRTSLEEDANYSPPPTHGFWSEPPGDAQSYFAFEGTRRVLVIERRTRLYPVAPGHASVGPALSQVTLSTGGMPDPFSGFGGLDRQVVPLVSDSIGVEVRPLPPGAPPGFAGAVGQFAVAWLADRSHVAMDQPVTLALDLRGVGNLPLLRAPALGGPGYEVFGNTAEDSLAPPGSDTPGRRRFLWTVLPRRSGKLEIAAPAFAWFDPAAGAYRSVTLPPIELDVTSARLAVASDEEDFPSAFASHPARPGARAARGWAFALAGLALGGSVLLWRLALKPPADAPERAQRREWLRAVGLAHGPDFWRAADEAVTWLESRGGRVAHLRADISTARYGRGVGVDEADVRRRLVERLGESMAESGSPWRLRGLAIACAVVAAIGIALGIPAPGREALAARARSADASARAGRLEAARAEWLALWTEAPGDAALAARIALAELKPGRLGAATLWTLRGRAGEPRDAALRFIEERVREGGGLVGAGGGRAPLRSLEWAILALLLGMVGVSLWPLGPERWRERLTISIALVALCALVAGWRGLETMRFRSRHDAVVLAETPLEGAGLDLAPGEVVRVTSGGGDTLHARAGRGLEGDVPARAVARVEAPR